jgi:hypothetical protein
VDDDAVEEVKAWVVKTMDEFMTRFPGNAVVVICPTSSEHGTVSAHNLAHVKDFVHLVREVSGLPDGEEFRSVDRRRKLDS